MKMTINGKSVVTNGFFAYDGCHKIYICEDIEDVELFTHYGYDFLPIFNLPEIYRKSCCLKFISNAKLDKYYVPQVENYKKVCFRGFKTKFKEK